MPQPPDLLITVANYDFSGNATVLKQSLSQYAHTILIDASSPFPPPDVDVSVPNTMYPGLWNASVKAAIEVGATWVYFIASDVEIQDAELLVSRAQRIIADDRVGCYTPSLHASSRCAFHSLFQQSTQSLRQCAVAEGFCFLARRSLLEQIYPIPPINKFGWSVDKLLALNVERAGLLNVVDDCIAVFHPASRPGHAIDNEEADRCGFAHLETRGISIAQAIELVRRDRIMAVQPVVVDLP